MEPEFEINPGFQTPPWCCDVMVSMVPAGVRTVLEPTPGLGNLASALRKASYEVTAPTGDFFKQDWQGKKFDAVVMNPPFSPPKLGYDIMFQCMEMSESVICLQPWEVIINSERRLRRIKEYGLKSVSHLPRKTFPGARVRCCILELSKGYSGPVTFQAIEFKETRE